VERGKHGDMENFLAGKTGESIMIVCILQDQLAFFFLKQLIEIYFLE